VECSCQLIQHDGLVWIIDPIDKKLVFPDILASLHQTYLCEDVPESRFSFQLELVRNKQNIENVLIHCFATEILLKIRSNTPK